MRTSRTICLSVLLAALAGCATQAKFQAKMDGFLGQPEAALVGTYGPPQASYTLADGSRVLQYTRGGQVLMPGATTYQPVTSSTAGNMTLNQGAQQTTGTYTQRTTSMVPVQQPGVPINLSCTVNFTVDAAGTVRQWSASGNHCVAN